MTEDERQVYNAAFGIAVVKLFYRLYDIDPDGTPGMMDKLAADHAKPLAEIAVTAYRDSKR